MNACLSLGDGVGRALGSRHSKGHEKTLKAMDMFIILISVMVLEVYINIRTYEIL